MLYSMIRAMKCLMNCLHWTRTKWTAIENEKKRWQATKQGKTTLHRDFSFFTKKTIWKKKTYLVVCDRRFLMSQMVVGTIK